MPLFIAILLAIPALFQMTEQRKKLTIKELNAHITKTHEDIRQERLHLLEA